ncbi:hypothetical protein CMV30_02235 [Nibricoccus aquaticus]|uniref:Uncharacterized protein n=1 Tax=Nibricoccus aquaticus TaxID=2576891 RepID=A0A290Q2Z3_9BACT|nr:hypothetical protein [Nibricoccus aquaticus]ATC62874.1 hypothetical protein CMV30_02235 [Nibricoccus aquaticus]
MSDHPSPAPKNFWITLGAIIGGFAIFLLILFIAYLPQQPAPLPEGTKTPAERAQILAEIRAKDKAAATTYAWVDQATGVVRLPTDRAVELTIKELNAKK